MAVYNFSYTGSAQQVTLPAGRYTLEVWGAQGGTYSNGAGGKGGYASGVLTLSKSTTLYINVGGVGGAASSAGGWNGGGASKSYGGSGGGATDIRIDSTSLYARVIVAGGGGGNGYSTASPGGYGGGTSGGSGASGTYSGGSGGTQTSGGSGAGGSGIFGSAANSSGNGGAGGGGWYGGGAGQGGSVDSAGGGGSGYTLTASSSKPSGYLLTSQHYLISTVLTAGNASMPNPSGGTMVGNTGYGYARITSLTSPPSVSNISATSITANSATIGGNVSDTGGENPARYICWGTVNGGTGTWQNTVNSGSGGTGNFTTNLANLQPGTTYYYRVRATNSTGTTWASTTSSFKTDPVSIAIGGTATCGGRYPDSESPAHAFDNSLDTKWLQFKDEGNPFWLQYQFAGNKRYKLTGYRIATANDSEGRDPKTWEVLGSNTGAFAGEEVQLHYVADGGLSANRKVWKDFSISDPISTGFRYMRLNVISTKDAGGSECQLAEWSLQGEEVLITIPVADTLGTTEVTLNSVTLLGRATSVGEEATASFKWGLSGATSYNIANGNAEYTKNYYDLDISYNVWPSNSSNMNSLTTKTGANSFKVQGTSNVFGAYTYIYPYYTIPNEIMTLSCKVKNNSSKTATINLRIRDGNNGDLHLAGITAFTIPSGEIRHCSLTTSITSSINRATPAIGVFSDGTDGTVDVEVFDIQFEAKDHSTAFIAGERIEPTTNLYGAPGSARVLSIIDANGTLSYGDNSGYSYNGHYIERIIKTNSTPSTHASYRTCISSQGVGNTFTISYKVKVLSGNISSIGTHSNGGNGASTPLKQLEDGWYYFERTGVTVHATTLCIGIAFFGDAAIDCLIAEPQVEFKNHATPFTNNSRQGQNWILNPPRVRYIRDYLGYGSTANAANHWVEIQAIDKYGRNVALGKYAVNSLGQEVSPLTDGSTDTTQWTIPGMSAGTYMTVDLGAEYELSQIKVWHYHGDGRTYYKTKTAISKDGVSWADAFDSQIEGEYAETAGGHIIDLNNLFEAEIAGLTGGARYDFKAYAENSAGGGEGSLLSFSLKYGQSKPQPPTVSDVGPYSAVLTSSVGSHILCNGETKPSGSVWRGLQLYAEYSATSFYPETETHYRSEDSEAILFRTTKYTQDPPTAPIASDITPSSVVLTSSNGSQITCNGVTKPSGSVWSGLKVNDKCIAIAFFPETDTHYRSENSAAVLFNTAKYAQHPPTALSVSGITTSSVVLSSNPGAIIVCDNTEKASGSTWNHLTNNRQYTAYAYLPETPTHYKSENRTATFSTLKCDAKFKINEGGDIVNTTSRSIKISFYDTLNVSSIIIRDSYYHDNHDSNHFSDNNAFYYSDMQRFSDNIEYELPNRYGLYEVSISFLDSGGAECGSMSRFVRYAQEVQAPDFTLSQVSEGVDISPDFNLVSLASIEATVTTDVWDMTFVPKSKSGFSSDLFITTTRNRASVYNSKWEHLGSFTADLAYTGVCYDHIDNCLWLHDWTDTSPYSVHKILLSNDGKTFTETGFSFPITNCIGIATDGNYIYGTKREKRIVVYTKTGTLIKTIELTPLSPNFSYTEGIEVFNNYAYVASDNGFIHVIDLENIDAPRLVAERQMISGDIDKLCTDGHYLYFANDSTTTIHRTLLLPRITAYRSANQDSGFVPISAQNRYVDFDATDLSPIVITAESTTHTPSIPSNKNKISFTWSDVSQGTRYYYYIKAVDAYGNESLVNHPSNICPPYKEWALSGGAWVDSGGVLYLPSYGAKAVSPLIPIQQAANWRISFDCFDDEPRPGYTDMGGYLQGSAYFDVNKIAVNNSSGYKSNGNASTYPLNEWIRKSWSYTGGLGVEYIQFNVSTSATYTSPSYETRLPMVTIDGQWATPYQVRSVLVRKSLTAQGFSFVLDKSANTTPSATPTSDTSWTSDLLYNGSYYLHVKLVGESGESNLVHLGPFIISTAPPVVKGVAIVPNPVTVGKTVLIQVLIEEPQ